jgi:REP element-mobilizing transposase RayT
MLEECHGSCLLQKAEFREDVVQAIKFYDSDYYRLHCAVVMPNHVHLAIQPNQGVNLESILGRIKSWSARRINRKTGQSGGFWMEECFDHIIRNESNYQKTIRYILNNPTKARLRQDECWIQGPQSC